MRVVSSLTAFYLYIIYYNNYQIQIYCIKYHIDLTNKYDKFVLLLCILCKYFIIAINCNFTVYDT
jgi:hypothetical protein